MRSTKRMFQHLSVHVCGDDIHITIGLISRVLSLSAAHETGGMCFEKKFLGTKNSDQSHGRRSQKNQTQKKTRETLAILLEDSGKTSLKTVKGSRSKASERG